MIYILVVVSIFIIVIMFGGVGTFLPDKKNLKKVSQSEVLIDQISHEESIKILTKKISNLEIRISELESKV